MVRREERSRDLRLAAITLIAVVLAPSSSLPPIRPFNLMVEVLIGSLAGWIVSVFLDSNRLAATRLSGSPQSKFVR